MAEGRQPSVMIMNSRCPPFPKQRQEGGRVNSVAFGVKRTFSKERF
jgi:hypothetical protein